MVVAERPLRGKRAAKGEGDHEWKGRQRDKMIKYQSSRKKEELKKKKKSLKK